MKSRKAPVAQSAEANKEPIPVVQYVRMSTEHQQYSTDNQKELIAEYAKAHEMNVIRTYADEGKSGLKLAGRDALKSLLDLIKNGKPDFKAILVYDVSRWGRYQDVDEAAYYEFICKFNGIELHYCAEEFKNDGSIGANVMKSLKRSIAAETVRELSKKVFKGQCHLITLGYRQGGAPGYGLRRMLIDEHGNEKGLLKRGERKSLQMDRVVLVPGPDEEVEVVRSIYRMFIGEGKTEEQIAEFLNNKKIRTDLGRKWTRGTILQILSNEKYIGNNLFNRKSFKLKQKHVTNPPHMWVRRDEAFPAIVDLRDFGTVQGILLERSRIFSDEEMLERLEALFKKHGRISGILINEAEDMPCASAYSSRFGSLIRAYRLVGYAPDIDYSFIETNRRIRQMHPEVVAQVFSQLQSQGSTIEPDEETGLWLVNQEITVSLVLSRCARTKAGSLHWNIRLEQGHRPDITIAARLDADNAAIRDYYLLPSLDMTYEKLRLAEFNGAILDVYRYDDLNFFYELTLRMAVEEIA